MRYIIYLDPYSRVVEDLNRYYPSFITKDKNGSYGICSPSLGVEKSGIISGKEIFDKIGIPEFDLCEYQEEPVLERLRKSIEWDLLNEVHNFGTQPWAEEAEKKFLEKAPLFYKNHRGEGFNPFTHNIREQLFETTSKYLNVPLFYLAHPGHFCLDVHCFGHYSSYEKFDDIPGRMWGRGWVKLSETSKQLEEDDILILTKNTRPIFRMDEMRYFCILQVVNLSSRRVKFIDFDFALMCHPRGSLRDINREKLDGKGDAALQIEQQVRQNSKNNNWLIDYISILTKDRTQNAYIKLSNMVEKEMFRFSDDTSHTTIRQFSYDFATADEICKVKEILDKK